MQQQGKAFLRSRAVPQFWEPILIGGGTVSIVFQHKGVHIDHAISLLAYFVARAFCISTMSTKSLGTLPVIYAVDEQQIPSPIKQCCLKVIQIALVGEMMPFQVANGFGYRFIIV